MTISLVENVRRLIFGKIAFLIMPFREIGLFLWGEEVRIKKMP